MFDCFSGENLIVVLARIRSLWWLSIECFSGENKLKKRNHHVHSQFG